MRINKYIAHNTHYSRKEAEQLIKDGRVAINKKCIKALHVRIKEDEQVYIDSYPIKKNNKYTVIAYHKPKGEIVSKKDDRKRRVIYQSLPKYFQHFISVGRLDFASEGLLLLTDSPEVAHILTQSTLPRVYYLKIHGTLNQEIKQAMLNGLELDDARAGGHSHSKIYSMKFAPFLGFDVLRTSKHFTRLRVMINEGQNRELRRFFASFGRDVLDLKRVSFGFVSLNQLRTRQWRYLEKKEYNKLHKFLAEVKK